MTANNEYDQRFEEIEKKEDRLTGLDRDDYRTHIEKNNWAELDGAEGEWEPIVGMIMSQLSQGGDVMKGGTPELKVEADDLWELASSIDFDNYYNDESNLPKYFDEDHLKSQIQLVIEHLIDEEIFETDGSEIYILKSWNKTDLSQYDYLNWVATFEIYVDMIGTFEDTIGGRIDDLNNLEGDLVGGNEEVGDDGGDDKPPETKIEEHRNALIDLFDGNRPPKPKRIHKDASGEGFFTVVPPEGEVPDSIKSAYKDHWTRIKEIKYMENDWNPGPDNIENLKGQLRRRRDRLDDLRSTFETAINQFRWAAVNAETTEETQHVKDCMQSMKQLFLAVGEMEEKVDQSPDDLYEELFPEADPQNDTNPEANTDDLDKVDKAEQELKDNVDNLEELAQNRPTDMN